MPGTLPQTKVKEGVSMVEEINSLGINEVQSLSAECFYLNVYS